MRLIGILKPAASIVYTEQNSFKGITNFGINKNTKSCNNDMDNKQFWHLTHQSYQLGLSAMQEVFQNMS